MKRLASIGVRVSSFMSNTHSKIIKSTFLLLALSVAPAALAAPVDEFVTTWKTDNPGDSNDTSITAPMIGGPYDVDWNNDGTFDEFGLANSSTHDYGVAGIYTIRIRGTYDAIQFDNSGDREKILSLDQWGTNQWTTMANAFYGAENLQVLATDTPDFSAVTSMEGMFRFADTANPDTSGWDTAAVTDMRDMFDRATAANPDTSGWDTAAVTDMAWMFQNATAANPDTSGWDTSAVTTMRGMFQGATVANPDTSGWDTAAVTDMSFMFSEATAANPDTSGWDTAAVTNMLWMFRYATAANPDTSGWDTAAVTNMESMFRGATSVDRDIGSWNVGALTNADLMFDDVTLSTANYESLLIGWNSQALQTGVSFSGGNSNYCSAAAKAAKFNMIASDSWIITDGGQECPPLPDLIFKEGFEDQ